MQKIEILSNQLSRSRSLNNFYHKQFLFDLRYGLFLVVILYVAAYTLSLNIFLLIPYIILLISVLLSYHAHYLIFSRMLSEDLEKEINSIKSEKILIAHEIENKYFYPTSKRKIVVAAIGKDFSWFSFVTLFITFLGSIVYMHSMYLIHLNSLTNYGYFILVFLTTFLCLIVGIWWFINGTGEGRIKKVLDNKI